MGKIIKRKINGKVFKSTRTNYNSKSRANKFKKDLKTVGLKVRVIKVKEGYKVLYR